ncbi:PEP-CTERM sorting domain-containing protein [Granulicella sp. dw_53]|uniref:PEP-CTERM sorting domain-containing protein n=1 Tax=Granulicella sp. dw_53 TaxID=2719792 RepID=UPI001BD2C231|nr:PEP-CTERM sorting domain-containing protein [Granulicella sp. dw_53]
MRLLSFFVVALLSIFAPFAVADTLQTSFNASVTTSISSPNDNYYGTYTTDHPKITDYPSLGNSLVTVNVPDFSLYLPAGSVISSATARIIAPTTTIEGTGFLYTRGSFPPPDTGEPSIAPTFTNTGSSSVFADYISGLSRPTIDGNEVYLEDAFFTLGLDGTIRGFLATPGENWSGYIGGSGQVTIPYTVELDVTYSMAPVPEPSTFALLAPGVLGVAGAVRRRCRRC